MKLLTQAINTALFLSYTGCVLWVGWTAHERLSPILKAIEQVEAFKETVQNLPGLNK